MNKTIKNNIATKVFYVFLVLIGILVLNFIGEKYYSWNIIGFFTQKPFDSKEWKVKYNSKNPVRQNMVKNLLNKYDLKGMTKEQIEELLGKPNSDIAAENQYRYCLGMSKNFFPIDEQELVIVFRNNIVQECFIFR